LTPDPQLSPRCLEWFDANALKIVRGRFPELTLPTEARAGVFFEQECTLETEAERLEGWYNRLVATGALVDAENGVIVADSDARQQLLYDVRHAVPAGVNETAARNRMPKVGTDLAVPDEALETMMETYARGVADLPGSLGPTECVRVLLQLQHLPIPDEAALESAAALTRAVEALEQAQGLTPGGLGLWQRIMVLWDAQSLPHSLDFATFGHIGNNHVHVNLLPRTEGALLAARRLYHAWTLKAISLGGSVSGEHGIGKIKRPALEIMLGKDAIAQMKAVKAELDPHGILGVGNLFERPASAGAA